MLKILALGKKYGLSVQFVAPELMAQALEANVKISRFGIPELERIIFDLFAGYLADARTKGLKEIAFGVTSDGKIVAQAPRRPAA